jgi:RNA polymerase sigma-70 factor (ECF subfamily)
VEGAARVARFLTNVVQKIPVTPQMALRAVNGEPGLVLSFAGQPFLAMALEIDDGRIMAVRMVVNPDKLSHVTASLN